MSDPKRHHWWPILQSKRWTGVDGLIHVVKADGSFYKANPKNIGLEGDLYTRYEITGRKDLTIERWFSEEVEGPFRETLDFISSKPGLQKQRLYLNQEGLAKRELSKEHGFIVSDYRESIDLPPKHRLSLAKYLSVSRLRKSAQDAKWNFCLTVGTLWPANQERPCRDDRAGTTPQLSRLRW
ncbi:MAG TPA: hypothetical protein VHY10_13600, partial [Xanthobacteraceae bacterium]|nr:hypothetical protein [Xanthobacteraceae bacterium]